MSIKTRIQQVAFNRHVLLNRLDSSEQLREFLTRFREKYVSCDLIRIGGDADGGYLIPDNLKDVKYCFSPGVDYTANFERELSERYNIKSFMADASVDSAPITDKNFEFVPKFLGSRTHNSFTTLSDWLWESLGDEEGAKILQMDIEGGEYDVLTYEDSETFASFSTIIIEFHALEKLFQGHFLHMFSAVFEKLYRNFSICHVHANNCCGIAELDGIGVPRVMEVTFIRNDIVTDFARNADVTLPHALDRKNVANNPDLIMPDIWWKK